MKRTFITYMPDDVGAFLKVSNIARECECNIIRISYNKSVDVHTSFIDAEGEQACLEKMEAMLEEISYHFNGDVHAQVLFVDFILKNEVGSDEAIFEIISDLNISIAYMNFILKEDAKHFRAGFFLYESKTAESLIARASEICEVNILRYDTRQIPLGSAIFYVSFAGDMRHILDLNQDDSHIIMANANAIMQNLEKRGEPAQKTFDYIKRYARFIAQYKAGEYYMIHREKKLTEKVTLHLFMPPCGSNIHVMECGDKIVCVDSSFACFRDEIIAEISKVFPNFTSMKKDLWLTHADIDHAGNADLFDNVYGSHDLIQNFKLESAGEFGYRQQDSNGSAYCNLSNIITGYKTPSLKNMRVIEGEVSEFAKYLTRIGEISFGDLTFDVLSGEGGHVLGETIYVCREVGLIFTGDNYVNIRGFLKEQAAFNKLAPYLLTSVNMNSKIATSIRKKIEAMAAEKSTILCSGHGDWVETV